VMNVYSTDGKMVASQMLNNLVPDGRENIELRGVIPPGSYILNFITNDHLMQTFPIIITDAP